MFDRTRRKIVFTVVFSLFALMSVTLATIYVSNLIAIAGENEEMLKTYAERYYLERLPQAPGDDRRSDRPGERDGKPGPRGDEPDKNEPRFQLSTFYAVAYSPEGEVVSVNNGNDALQSESSLIAITDSILKGSASSGRTGSFAFLVDERNSYTLVVLLDSTIGDSDRSLLFTQMLCIGGAALAVLVVVSVFIARRIVRPLEENDVRQKRFVSDAGHELKTPIAVISANSELLRREAGDSEWLDNIDYENSRMSELVKQLLMLSKAENGDIPKETLDLSKLVDGETLPFESLAFEKGVKIKTDLEPSLAVKGNPAQLRQLVSILLDNALSHGTGDTVEINLRRERHSAVLTVANAAEKMDVDQLSHLFDRFYRADQARGDDGSHYGLGLSIAKAVAESHGASIHADYKDSKAVFTVCIPMEKS